MYGRPGQYSTVTEHMPEDHQKYLEWNGDRFRKWADKIGINTYKVIDALLTSGRAEQQSYALGMEACKRYYTVKYVRLPDLLLDLEATRDDRTFNKVIKAYTTPQLLILDKWLLMKLTEDESKNVFELIHRRRKHSSTIFCSQFRDGGWYERLGGDNNPLADAIMDRIAYDSYKINIESTDKSKDISMREVYGLNPADVQ